MADFARMVRPYFALLIIATLLAGCAGAPAPAPAGGQPAAKPLGTVTIRVNGDWPQMDPSPAPGGASCNIPCTTVTFPIYDRLITAGPDPKNPGKNTILPYLAESWEITSSRITFKIRKDATCTDGAPMNASLIKRNFERITGGGRNVAGYGGGPFTFAADDATGTFTMNFVKPFNDAIYAFTSAQMICPAGLADEKVLAEKSFGSGPYTVVEAVHGDHVTYKRREEWKWGPSGITAKDLPETLIVRVIPNETTAANLLITGGLDIAAINGPDVGRLINEKSLILKTSTSYYNYPLYFNHDPARPTGDVKVREALASAIDPKEFNQAAYAGRGVLSTSYLMPGADCYDPSTADLMPKSPSPDKAKQMLTSLGWTPGPNGKLQKNGKPLVVQVMAVPAVHGAGGEYIAAQWEKAGVTVDTSGITDFNTWSQRRFKSDFDATAIVWPRDLPDPSTSIGFYLGPNNQGKVNNVEAWTAVGLAQKAEGAERCKQWSIVQKSMLKNFDILPLSAPTNHYFGRGIDFVPAGINGVDVFFFKRVN